MKCLESKNPEGVKAEKPATAEKKPAAKKSGKK